MAASYLCGQCGAEVPTTDEDLHLVSLLKERLDDRLEVLCSDCGNKLGETK